MVQVCVCAARAHPIPLSCFPLSHPRLWRHRAQKIRAGRGRSDVEGVLYAEEDLVDDRYCLWVDEGFYFDMVDQTRWINHSCAPNVEVEAELDGKGGAWARIVACRTIEVGEELTYDYAFPAALAEACSCGTPDLLGMDRRLR